MASQRQSSRIDCASHCVLMDCGGNSYEALLENISTGGALIKVKNGVPNGLRVGDICSLAICDNPVSCTLERFCKVVRHDTVFMGISFMTSAEQ
jgi:c-di-GMP-binding flagellar brake protein YcgR